MFRRKDSSKSTSASAADEHETELESRVDAGNIAISSGVELEFLVAVVSDHEQDPWKGEEQELGISSTFPGPPRPVVGSPPGSSSVEDIDSLESQVLRLLDRDVAAFTHVKHLIGRKIAAPASSAAADTTWIDFWPRRATIQTFISGRVGRETYETDWVVKGDSSIDMSDVSVKGSFTTFQAVEATSPILPMGVMDCIDSASRNPEDDENDDKKIAEYLKFVIRSIKGGTYTRVNDTCGLHVHVGLGGLRYTLLALKKVGTLLWLSEGMLEKLYGARRRARPGASHYAKFTQFAALGKLPEKDLRNFARGLAQQRKATGSSELPWYHYVEKAIEDECKRGQAGSSLLLWQMRALWAQLRKKDVSYLLCIALECLDVYKLAYNFYAFGTSTGEQMRGTIEFRLMEGTMNEYLVTSWVHVCRQFVRRAIQMSSEEFGTMAKTLLAEAESGYTVRGFLKELNCSDEVCDYFQQRVDNMNPHCADQSTANLGNVIPLRCRIHGDKNEMC